MLTLPLPVVVALALIFTAVRAWIGGDRGRWHPMLIVLVLAVAGQGLLVAAVQHYGFTGLRWLQPVIASAIPPLAWCAFLAVQLRPLRARDAVHALVPLLVAACVRVWPDGLDLLVVAAFVGYGLALMRAVLPGAPELPLARLASGNLPRWLWRAVALSLLVSALGDALIYLDQLTQGGQSRAVLISVMSSLTLLALGSVALSSEWRTSETADEGTDDRAAAMPAGSLASAAPTSAHADTDADDSSADPALLARLEAHMREARPWLNPDLTLVALARKLGVPSKALSAAVNQGHGENVARYVNRHRIEHACALLRQGQPVTTALYDSGFNTKSNFHREFLRIHGTTPTQWLEQAGKLPATADLSVPPPAPTSSAAGARTRP